MGVADSLPHRSAYMKVQGLSLHYIDYGGCGDVVVILPGLLQSAESFSHLAPLLQPYCHLILLDLRGRGESDWGPPDRYTWTQYYLDLQEFLTRLNLPQVTLLGSSLGGGLALMYAIVHPGQVAGLVLNDCTITPDYGGMERGVERTQAAPRSFASLDAAADWFVATRVGLRRLTRADLLRWVRGYLTSDAAGGWVFRCDPLVIATAERHLPRPQARIPWTRVQHTMLRRLTMPVLLLRGELSDVLRPASAQQLVALAPQARCVVVPGVGHAPTLFEPEAQQGLLEFFSGQWTQHRAPHAAGATSTIGVGTVDLQQNA